MNLASMIAWLCDIAICDCENFVAATMKFPWFNCINAHGNCMAVIIISYLATKNDSSMLEAT